MCLYSEMCVATPTGSLALWDWSGPKSLFSLELHCRENIFNILRYTRLFKMDCTESLFELRNLIEMIFVIIIRQISMVVKIRFCLKYQIFLPFHLYRWIYLLWISQTCVKEKVRQKNLRFCFYTILK